MPRVTQAVSSNSRHKKVLKQAKGYDGARSRCFKTANQADVDLSLVKQVLKYNKKITKQD